MQITLRFSLAFLILFGFLTMSGAARGAGPSDAFFEADACAREIRKSPPKQKLRANWTGCIDRFQAVYRQDPKGPWAPASLFNSGTLYSDMARTFASEADRKAAIDQFELLQKRFPDSGYRDRAGAELQRLTASGPIKEEKPPLQAARGTTPKTEPERKSGAPEKKPTPAAAPPAAAKDPLAKADACYRKLQAGQPTEATRRDWMLCIGRFHNAYLEDPSGPAAPQALYQEGMLYLSLHKALKFDSDLRFARENFEKIAKEYPGNEYAAKANREIQAMPRSRAEIAAAQQQQQRRRPAPAAPPSAGSPSAETPGAPATSSPPAGAGASDAAAESTAEGLAVVQDLKFWSNPDYSRVVVYLDRDAPFTHSMLKRDPALDKPPRLYVDLAGATIGGGAQKTVPIDDNLLSAARAARYTLDSVRVVVDIKSFQTYKVFSLNDPFRVVIDVWGRNGQGPEVAREPAAPGGEPDAAAIPDPGRKIPRGALAKQLALGVRRIVVDPGHGGKDFGAPGFIPGVHEKDLVLEIAKRVARRIRDDLGLEAVLTRRDDRYLTLEERTAFANTHRADLFVSVHTNASRDPRAYGTETYFLNLATDDESIRVAAMENATSTKNISDLHSILNDLLKNAKINESSRLAGYVQGSLIRTLSAKYDQVKDKGVKQAPFYVLLGARMPSILVETGFISNQQECRRLSSAAYQEHLAESIVRGLQTYIRGISPMALDEPPRGTPG
jgi:N-acetylmuramoyl-L-alanine amidase